MNTNNNVSQQLCGGTGTPPYTQQDATDQTINQICANNASATIGLMSQHLSFKDSIQFAITSSPLRQSINAQATYIINKLSEDAQNTMLHIGTHDIIAMPASDLQKVTACYLRIKTSMPLMQRAFSATLPLIQRQNAQTQLHRTAIELLLVNNPWTNMALNEDILAEISTANMVALHANIDDGQDLNQQANTIIQAPEYADRHVYKTHRNLTALPLVEKFAHAETMDLSYNALSILPEGLVSLQNLLSLTVDNNSLRYIDPALCNHQHIHSLSLAHNRLHSLPDNFQNMSRLNSLNLSNNPLKRFPRAITNCTQLENLDLSFTNISAIPSEILRMERLKNINLSHNSLTCVPQELFLLQNIEGIDLSCNTITSLPSDCPQNHNILELDCSNNKLTTLPNNIFTSALKIIKLTANRITSIPITINQCTSIESLSIEYNCLTTLPDMDQLHSLRHLFLNNNQLIELPRTFGKLPQIQMLNLEHNTLKNLPSRFGAMPALETLYLNHNSLTALPTNLIKSQQISELNIGFNQFKQFPVVISRLKNLRSLTVDNNHLKSFRTSLLRKENLPKLQKFFALHNPKTTLSDEEHIALEHVQQIALNDIKINRTRRPSARLEQPGIFVPPRLIFEFDEE